MEHIHGPDCGCKDIAFSEGGQDLAGAISLDHVLVQLINLRFNVSTSPYRCKGKRYRINQN